MNYDKTIHEIRKFNRFYTINMGFLNSNYLDSSYSVAETRILFEIKTHKTCIQNDIVKALYIDKSYLSRIIHKFCKQGLVQKIPAENDKRTTKLMLTVKGNDEAERLIALTHHQIEKKISQLSLDECHELCHAFNTIISILGKEAK